MAVPLLDLSHIIHTIPTVAAYGTLGTMLFPTIVRQLDLSRDNTFHGTLRWSARMFFLGCALFHLVVFGSVLLTDVSGFRHFFLHLTAIPQAIGGPVFVRAVIQSASARPTEEEWLAMRRWSREENQ